MAVAMHLIPDSLQLQLNPCLLCMFSAKEVSFRHGVNLPDPLPVAANG